jgi:hypothetical protein
LIRRSLGPYSGSWINKKQINLHWFNRKQYYLQAVLQQRVFYFHGRLVRAACCMFVWRKIKKWKYKKSDCFFFFLSWDALSLAFLLFFTSPF